MTIKYCPRCQSRFPVNPRDVDVVHSCNSGNNNLDQDDKVVVGEWTDINNTSGGARNVHLQGIGARNFGNRSNVEYNERIHDLTSRGKRVPTHRQSSHEEYIELR